MPVRLFAESTDWEVLIYNTIISASHIPEIVNIDFEGNMILADDEENAKMGIETGEWVLFGPNGRIK